MNRFFGVPSARAPVWLRLCPARGVAFVASAIAALLVALVPSYFLGQPTVAQTQTVTVTGVQPNNSSVRIFYNPVSGAKDYRAFDTANPSDVKYAGQIRYTPGLDCPGNSCTHAFTSTTPSGISPTNSQLFQVQQFNSVQSGPATVQDQPALDIDWNALNDGNQHAIVVQAVDALGPAPEANLYSTQGDGPHVPLAGGGMLGSNKGPTADGNTTTNGQGPYTNNPHAIAQSQPIVVQAQPGITPLVGGSQQFLDTFDQSEAGNFVRTVDGRCQTDAAGNLGYQTYTLDAGTPKAWTIEYRQMDGDNSMPFISNSHFMDMLFDGASPSCGSAPSDTIYGSMAMTPQQTMTANGGIVHLSMLVDSHMTFRRWMGFDLSPASDPLQSWEQPANHALNNSNSAFYFDMSMHGCALDIYNSGGNAGTPAFTSSCDLSNLFDPQTGQLFSHGFDDRTKWDLFVSQTHVALFQDGRLAYQTDIPASAMPWFSSAAIKAYFTHYTYHTDADINDLETVTFDQTTLAYPENSYWFNDPVNGTSASSNSAGIAYPPGYGFPHSDERHWDNMGFEVLSATSTSASDFSALGSNVQLPAVQAPQFSSGSSSAPTATSTLAAPTSTSTLVATATQPPTATPVLPTSTPRPSMTPTSTPLPSITPTQPPATGSAAGPPLWSLSARVSNPRPVRGQTIILSLKVQASAAATATVDEQLSGPGPGGPTLDEQEVANQAFQPNVAETFNFNYTIPLNAPTGLYSLSAAVLRPDGSALSTVDNGAMYYVS